MKSTEIKKLMEAFYLGETSQEEEQMLFAYFQEETVEDEWQSDKAFLMQMHRLKNDTVAATFAAQMNSKMDTLFDSFEKQEKQTSRVRKLWIRWGNVAAAFLMIGTIAWMFARKADNQADAYAQETVCTQAIPQQDFAFTERPLTEEDCRKIEIALTMVVESLEKGMMQQLEIVAENLAFASQSLNSLTN